jgi:hypothetical protein
MSPILHDVGDNLDGVSFVDLQVHLSELGGLPGRTHEATDLRIALYEHPDLLGYQTPAGKVLPCSVSVNSLCDKVSLEYWGDDFMALPYLEDKGVRLYSNPPAFYLGVRNLNGFGVVPYQDWEQWLDEAKLDFSVRKYCRHEMQGKSPVYY